MAPRPTPGQVAWLNHLFEGQQDFRRKPTAPPQPSPAQKAAKTRARNAARARAASVPDYEPHMQNTGGRPVPKGDNLPILRRPSGPPAIRTSSNLPVLYKGPKPPAVIGGGEGLPKAPPRGIKIPSLRGIVRTGVKAAAKFGLTGVSGAIVGSLAAPDMAEGSSGGAEATLAMRSPQRARDYIDNARRTAKAQGLNYIDVPDEVVAMASGRVAAVAGRTVGRNGKTRSTIQYSNETRPIAPAAAPSPKPRNAPSPTPNPAPSPKGANGKVYGAGRFLNKAYAYNTKNVSDRSIATKAQYASAMDKFKATHEWARTPDNAKQKRETHMAVQYLLKRKQKNYFTP